MPNDNQNDGDVVAARLTSQLLSGRPAGSAEQVVRRLLAVQAQDPRGARLSIRSRSTGLRASLIDEALSDHRTMVITWLNRGTLHLVAAEDYWWLHPLTTPQLRAANERRLRQEEVSPAQAARGVKIITEAVSSDGPQTRRQLADRLTRARVPTAGQALVHLFLAASIHGDVVRGPMVGKHQAFVPAAAWLGNPPPALARSEALATLARRYLAGHGPAGADDLAKWAGVTLGDARRGLEGLGDAIATLPGDLCVLAGAADAAPLPAPRLLGPFDPLLHGWASRRPFVGDHAGVVTTNGLFRPVALVRGRVVATWGLAGGTVTIRLLEPVSKGETKVLTDDALEVLRYLGLDPKPAVIESSD